MLYYADPRWRDWHNEKPEFRQFGGVQVSIQGSLGWERLAESGEAFVLCNYGGESAVLSRKPNGLATGQNSSYQAVNIAVLAGAAQIVLLGVDLKPAANGKTHWFGEHPVKTEAGIYSAMLNSFRRLAREWPKSIDIVNCSPDSALDCFRKASIESVLPHPAATALSA